MIRKFIFLALALVAINVASAQTVEELKTQKADKAAQLATLQGEVDALQKQIDEFPGWKFGGVGVLGLNFNGNHNNYSLTTPNASSNGLGLGFVAYANQDQDKYFWRNGLNINLSYLTTFIDKANKDTKGVTLTDLLDFSSLFGYKLNPKVAVSAEVKYLSSLIDVDQNSTPSKTIDDKYRIALNNPGQMIGSAGITWLPITNMVILVHPLGYQKNWPGEFISSPGAKLGLTYTKDLIKGLKWNTNLSAFIPYSSGGDVVQATDIEVNRTVNYSGGQLANWIWNNGFSFTLWKGIGVGLNVGLRGDKQIADKGRLNDAANTAQLEDPNLDAIQLKVDEAKIDDNPIQVFWNIGVSYGF